MLPFFLSASGLEFWVYYHVRLTVQGETHDEVRLNLDRDDLERSVLDPYRRDSIITLNGRSIKASDLARVRISASSESGQSLKRMAQEAPKGSRVFVIGGPNDDWRAAALADDVTDQFITGPPGFIKDGSLSNPEESTLSKKEEGRSLFIVAGRDNAIVRAMTELLRAMDLRIVQWSHAVARTNIPNPYIGDVVFAGMKMADAALVILTPDDVAMLRYDLQQDADGPTERTCSGQARPNVLYEAGIADALGRERTILLEVGNVKGFSDVAGRHVIRHDGSPGMQNVLAERLKLAGLAIDTAGQHWLYTEPLRLAIEAAHEALAGYANLQPTIK